MSVKREREKRENEKRAFQLILEAGEDGILQSDMWKRLESNSQTGSIIARKLERMGIIKRNREFNDGRWTYRLICTQKPITVESIIDCPCTACNDIDRCTPGLHVSPLTCAKLTYWLDTNTDTESIQPEELHEDNI